LLGNSDYKDISSYLLFPLLPHKYNYLAPNSIEGFEAPYKQEQRRKLFQFSSSSSFSSLFRSLPVPAERERQRDKRASMAILEETQVETVVGQVTCSAWIRRKEGKNSDNKLLVIMGRNSTLITPAMLELYTFDPKASSLSSDPWVLSLSLSTLSLSLSLSLSL
jgi:hypothetical protein